MPIAVSVVPLSEVAWTNTWPVVASRTLTRYSAVALTRRAIAYTYWWPPTASLSVATENDRSTSCAETVVSTALRVLPAAGTLIVPVVPVTS